MLPQMGRSAGNKKKAAGDSKVLRAPEQELYVIWQMLTDGGHILQADGQRQQRYPNLTVPNRLKSLQASAVLHR